MPTQVEIPEVGLVEFPDSMDQVAISAASKKLYEQKAGGGVYSSPGRKPGQAEANADYINKNTPKADADGFFSSAYKTSGLEGLWEAAKAVHEGRAPVPSFEHPLMTGLRMIGAIPEQVEEVGEKVGTQLADGNYGGAAGSVAGIVGPIVAPELLSGTAGAAKKIGAAAKSAGSKALTAASNPAVRDVVGIVSPRAGKVLDTLDRGKRIVDAVRPKGAPAPAPAATSAPTSPTPAPISPTPPPTPKPPAKAVPISGEPNVVWDPQRGHVDVTTGKAPTGPAPKAEAAPAPKPAPKPSASETLRAKAKAAAEKPTLSDAFAAKARATRAANVEPIAKALLENGMGDADLSSILTDVNKAAQLRAVAKSVGVDDLPRDLKGTVKALQEKLSELQPDKPRSASQTLRAKTAAAKNTESSASKALRAKTATAQAGKAKRIKDALKEKPKWTMEQMQEYIAKGFVTGDPKTPGTPVWGSSGAIWGEPVRSGLSTRIRRTPGFVEGSPRAKRFSGR